MHNGNRMANLHCCLSASLGNAERIVHSIRMSALTAFMCGVYGYHLQTEQEAENDQKEKSEPAVYRNGMAQTNGEPVEDIPDAAEIPDNVNHPAHYTFGSIEVIDVIRRSRHSR